MIKTKIWVQYCTIDYVQCYRFISDLLKKKRKYRFISDLLKKRKARTLEQSTSYRKRIEGIEGDSSLKPIKLIISYCTNLKRLLLNMIKLHLK
jgi:hypothetical protein